MVVQHLDIEAAVVYEIHYPGQHFVGMLAVVANATYADGGDLPGVLISHFGGGDLEPVLDLSDDGFYNAAFTF
jgi:hypothetical protein